MKEIISLLIWIILISYYINKKNKKKSNKKTYNYKDIYNKKQKLLTQNEKLFYNVLKEITQEKNIIINTQVVLYEIIETQKNKYFNYYFNKIKAKSIDYVLTDKEFNILLCIELDDITHKRKDRIKRDNFLNELFKELGIKLLRIPVQNYYNVERINKIIKESL